MNVAAKKEIPSKEANQKVNQDEGTPQTFEEALAANMDKIEAALKTVPPEKLAQAKKEVDQLLQGDLSWADLSKYTPERLLQIADMGYNQFKIGQYDRAERILKGLTVIDPVNYYYHQLLGATFQRKEQYPEALVEYSMAIDQNPRDLVSLSNRGEVYFKLGIFELANADFDKAIGLDPKNEDRWANRARMLREQIRIAKKRKK